MLSELKKLHADALQSIDELGRLTGEQTMRPEAVTTARLKLTRASRERSQFLKSTVYPRLSRTCSAPDARRVQAVQEHDKERMIRTADHIARWTPQEIAAHWPDYCKASRALSAILRGHIRREQDVFYPLLRD